MMHKKRMWCVVEVEGTDQASVAASLAEKLTEHSWCSCAGWRVRMPSPQPDYLFLNDQTSENGAFEVAILIERGDLPQVESITFSWCDQSKAEEYIRRALAGEYDAAAWPSSITHGQIQTPEQHRACSLCA